MKKMKSIYFLLIMFIAFLTVSPITSANEIAPFPKTPSQEPTPITELTNKSASGISWQYALEGKPNGLTGISSPFISYYIKITGDADYDLRMLVDGVQVGATYDKASGNLTYQTSNLTGSHEVAVQLYVYGQRYDITKWSFTVDPNPVNPFEAKNRNLLNAVQDESILRLNKYRAALSLRYYTVSVNLQKAAQAHTNYLASNNVTGHGEQPNGVGFTGSHPWDRASYFGFDGNAGEGITYQKKTGAMGVDDLMDAPYHRLSIIDPRNRLAGTGYNNRGDIVINYGSYTEPDQKAEVVVYPYDKQKDAKASWYVAENPNPLRFWGIDRVHVGYPISYAYFTNESSDQLIVDSLSLKDGNNRNISFYDVTPDKDNEGKHHVFLIPKSPLVPGQTYYVDVNAHVKDKMGENKDVSRSWSFTTANSIAVQDIYFTKYQGTNFIGVNLDSGEDPDSIVTIEKDSQLFLKYEGRMQWTYQSIVAGDYILTIESPLFQEKKKIPITIQKNNEIRFDGDGDWQVLFTEEQPGTIDTMPPQLTGIEDVTIGLHEPFDARKNITAYDDIDGDLTKSIVIEGVVDTSKVGIYKLTYKVSDQAGNETVKVRIVTVVEPNDGYTFWESEKPVPSNKDWTIQFSKEVDSTTIDLNTIYVHHNQQEVSGIKVMVNENRNSVTVKAPEAGYSKGQTYYLYIEGKVKSSSGDTLSKPIKYKFTIE
ncbi:immunoglobulin-like domain-containing protein [Sporosarcina sp. SAFN-015]|uniref:immunoglobulin-like domain-containing protein n=1 Tax=Sporosarcina sp. SAFN-015 TaxID=3387274 RepID=UPI003F7CE319